MRKSTFNEGFWARYKIHLSKNPELGNKLHLYGNPKSLLQIPLTQLSRKIPLKSSYPIFLSESLPRNFLVDCIVQIDAVKQFASILFSRKGSRRKERGEAQGKRLKKESYFLSVGKDVCTGLPTASCEACGPNSFAAEVCYSSDRANHSGRTDAGRVQRRTKRSKGHKQ